MTDPTRCEFCGVGLRSNPNPLAIYHQLERDGGEHHTEGRCRDFLFAEVERMRQVIQNASESLHFRQVGWAQDLSRKLAIAGRNPGEGES
jgi:hypothetical protein